MKFPNIGVFYRIILVVLLFIAVLTTVIYFIVKPTPAELLSKESWCVDSVYYHNVLIGPKTKVFVYMQDMDGKGPCAETCYFETNGRLQLPGINSFAIDGTWKMEGNGSIAIEADSLESVFNGKYVLEVTERQLQLKNSNTTIYAHKDNYHMPNPLNGLQNWRRAQRRW